MWIIDPPGLTTSIACCLETSNPTVSKTISKLLLWISLSSGLTNFASKYLEHSFNLNLFGSDKTIFLFPFIFERIKPHNNPIAPPPWTKVLHSLSGFFKDSSPISTAWSETAVGSATGASFLSSPFGIS